MLRIFAVALLAVGMSVGLAQAKGHKQRIAACGEGQQATATCACGIGAECVPARRKAFTCTRAQAGDLACAFAFPADLPT
jgi:hypothetical protein